MHLIIDVFPFRAKHNLQLQNALKTGNADCWNTLGMISKTWRTHYQLSTGQSPWWCPAGVRPAADRLHRLLQQQSSWAERLFPLPPSSPHFTAARQSAHTVAVLALSVRVMRLCCLSVCLLLSVCCHLQATQDFAFIDPVGSDCYFSCKPNTYGYCALSYFHVFKTKADFITFIKTLDLSRLQSS